MASGNLATARQSMLNAMKQLNNTQLKEILRGEQLTVGGNKVALQNRITSQIEGYLNDNDTRGFENLRRRIIMIRYPDRHDLSNTVALQSPSHGSMPSPSMTMAFGQPTTSSHGQSSGRRPTFRPSPFYHIVESLAGPANVPERPGNRDVVGVKFSLSAYHVQQLRNDTSLAVMLYCAATPSSSAYNAVHDIGFPDVEVRLNSEEVKSNYKGLKNKPGTTKPADLTPYLRKSHGAIMADYPNQLNFTYARTTKPYSLVINLVKKSSAEELIDKVRRGHIISQDKVLQEMLSRAKDPDIVATSTIMSLKDPISTMRIETPCRSTICSHNQCFDATNFILLQEQAPTWSCPICNKSISYELLAIDHYVLDILKRTSKSVDQVTIEPEGNWSEVKQRESAQSQTRASYDNDSDDDLVEIGKPNNAATPQATAGVAQPTPPTSINSRETSSRPNGSAKRPSAVIDLTFSDDEDEPPRPAKRQQSNTGSISAQNSRAPSDTSFAPPTAPKALLQPQSRAPSDAPSEPMAFRMGYGSRPAPYHHGFTAPPPQAPQAYGGQQSTAYTNYVNNGMRAPLPQNGGQGPFSAWQVNNAPTYPDMWRPNSNGSGHSNHNQQQQQQQQQWPS